MRNKSNSARIIYCSLLVLILTLISGRLFAGPVTGLAFTIQPNLASPGAPFEQQPVLKTVDQLGNPTTTGLAPTQYVTVALSGGGASLQGTLTYNIGTSGGNGVVDFTDLRIDVPGNNYVLTATLNPGFSPTNLANCQVWLDASVTNTITSSASVTDIADLSGNGNDFNIPVGSAGNIASTNTLNGLPVLTFTGGGANGQVLHNNTYRNTGATVTWFTVWRHSSATPNNFETPLSSSDGANPDYNQTDSFAPSATTPGGLNVDPRQERVSVVDVFTTATTIGTSPHLLDGYFDGTSSGLFLDGTLSQTHNASSGNFNIQVLSLGQRLDVGGTSSSVSSWQGDIAEIIIYNSALSAADQTTVRAYLTSKWVVGPASSAPFSVAVPGTAVRLSPGAGTLTTATTGTVYSLTFAATGGAAPYSFAVTSGLLPAGLSLSTNGILSGTPANLGNSAFSITATDNHSNSFTAAYMLTVAPANTRDLYSDTWVGTDALGRALPLYADVGGPRTNQSGIFYFLWEQGNNGSGAPYDITKILTANPGALTNTSSPPWGPSAAFHYWSEPLFGYYQMLDPWVLRRHAQMLSAAGMDMVLFDGSNGYTYTNVLGALATTWMAMRAQSNATPQFAYLCIPSDSTNAINEVEYLYNTIYSQGLYSNLWYYWQGKPLICAYPDPQLGATILNFFTFRKNFWQGLNTGPGTWNTDGYYPGGHNGGGTNEIMYDASGNVEQMAAATASSLYGTMSDPNTTGGDGRTWRDFAVTGSRDAGPNAVASGGQYSDEWAKVLQYNPAFALHYCWNEWVAQRLSSPHPVTFVDEFDPEYSKDIEPMTGGFGDDYYMQMVTYQRQFKGVRPPPATSAPQTIALNGDFSQWNTIAPGYFDGVGDTAARNFPVWGAGTYTDNSGRNDITAAKVAVDAANIYFWVQTAANLTAYTGTNWMQLLLDVDGNHTNGWNGFDYVVNSQVLNATNTTVRCFANNAISNVTYQVTGNQMMIAIPRNVLGLTGPSVSVDFHWVDNCPVGPGADIVNFWATGDSAPDGRFNYRYSNVVPVNSALVLTNVTYRGGTFTTSLSSISNDNYELQYKNSLGDSNWTVLTTTPGNGGNLTLTNPSSASLRFYRVRQY